MSSLNIFDKYSQYHITRVIVSFTLSLVSLSILAYISVKMGWIGENGTYNYIKDVIWIACILGAAYLMIKPKQKVDLAGSVLAITFGPITLLTFGFAWLYGKVFPPKKVRQ